MPQTPDDHEARVDPAGSSSQAGRVLRRRCASRSPLIQPVSRVEHAAPDEHAGHERHDVRQEEQDPEGARRRAGAASGACSATRNGRMTATGSASAANLSVIPSDVPDLLVVEQRLVVLEPDELERLGLGEVDVGEREDERRDHRDGRERTKPMSHGAMKTYPQRARRQASPEKRGWRARARDAGGRHRSAAARVPDGLHLGLRIASISASRSRPGVVCHLVPYVLSRSRVWL